ncbi:hypothetical protein [Sphingomonas sp. Leaf257]|uniref:hypothetical protein n=1 Tax=Sphingomonas sp. Leaf257 TaxID=1736309 RepID=UPI000AC22887|nr:hypothetical protein [Sphingomonas sp. Leaf257]
MHHHSADLSGRVQRWRAEPEALPALIRDHHAGTPADLDEPQQPEDPNRNDSAGAAFLAVVVALAIYLICGAIYVIYGVWMGCHDRL